MESTTHNPILPYSNYVGAFQSGRFVRIQGRSNYDAHSFKISFLTGPNLHQDDVALLIDLRFGEQTVIRNSKLYSSWGNEERHGQGFPLQRGQSFEVMVLCEGNVFKIALNGQHHAEFNHRVPPERITYFSMEGDGTVGILQFEGGTGGGGFAPSAPAAGPGAMPYPPGGLGSTGFVPPPPLPTSIPPSYSPNNPPYAGGYQSGPSYGSAGAYPHSGPYPQTGPAYPQAQGYPPGPGGGAYPPGPYGYGPQQQQGPYPGNQGSGSGGLMGNAQKLLAGVGLAGVASKIPGLIGGHGGHGQYPGQQYPGGGGGYYPGGGGHGHHSGGGGGMGMAGPLGGAAALGIGGALAAKMMKPKKMKKNKLLKYGLPLAGVGAGGYALHKGMKFGRRGSWSGSSSSSSSSEEE